MGRGGGRRRGGGSGQAVAAAVAVDERGDGELAPRQDNDGATVANFLPNQTCSSSEPEKCDGMLFSYRQANLNECIKPSMAYRFDELPVNLVKGGLGIFTVPSITEPASKSHDFLVFF